MNPIIQTILDQQDPPDDPYNPSNASVAADDGTGNVPNNAYLYASMNPTRPDTSGLERATRELGAAARRRAKAQREAAEEEENARRAQMGAGIGAEIARLISGQNIQTDTQRNMSAVAQAATARRQAEANEAGIDAESRARAVQRIAEINQAADASLREQEAAEAQRRVNAYNRRQDAINREALREEGVSERRADRASQREYQAERDDTQYQRQQALQKQRAADRRETARIRSQLENKNGGFSGEARSQMNGTFVGRPLASAAKNLSDITSNYSGDGWFGSNGMSSEEETQMREQSASARSMIGGLLKNMDSKTYAGQFTQRDADLLTQAQGILAEGNDQPEAVQRAVRLVEQTPLVQRVRAEEEARRVAANHNLSPQDQQAFAGLYAQNRMQGMTSESARNATVDVLNRSIQNSADGTTDTYDYGDFALPSGETSARSSDGRIPFEQARQVFDGQLTREQYENAPIGKLRRKGLTTDTFPGVKELRSRRTDLSLPSESNPTGGSNAGGASLLSHSEINEILQDEGYRSLTEEEYSKAQRDFSQNPSQISPDFVKSEPESQTSPSETSGSSEVGATGQAYTEGALQSARDEYGAVDLEADVIELGDDPTEAELDAAREEARRSDAPVLTFYQDGQRRISSGKDARDYLNRENTFLAGRALRSAGRGIASAVRGAGQAVANSMSLQPDQARELLSKEGYTPNQRAEVREVGGERFVLIKEGSETVERVPSERLNLGRLSGAQDYADRFNRLAQRASE